MDAATMFSPVDGILQARDNGALECISDLASDYYGLGVRLGVYFAWLNSYLAHTLLPSAIGGAADTNAVFMLTLFIAMVKDSLRGHLASVDALILMHLFGGATFGILTIWGYRTRLYRDKGPKAVGYFGSYGTHIRLILSFLISLYGIWFWSYGVTNGLIVLGPDDNMEEAEGGNDPRCGQVYTFFFAKIKADGAIRFYYIVICSLCAIYFGAMMAASSLTVWFSIERVRGRATERWARTAHLHAMVRPKYATGFISNELNWIYKFCRIGNAIWLVFSLLTVECTLNFNSLVGVLGGPDNDLSKPGQLLPFLVGTFGFLQTCYAILKQRWLQKDLLAGNETGDGPTDSSIMSPSRGGFGPTLLQGISTRDLDAQQKGRSWMVRWLVGWLPWLSLLQSYDERLAQQGISRSNTGLETLPPTPGLPMNRPHMYTRASTMEDSAGSPMSPWTPGFAPKAV